jgi:uncharacterized RDD family membrane protein YckC
VRCPGFGRGWFNGAMESGTPPPDRSSEPGWLPPEPAGRESPAARPELPMPPPPAGPQSPAGPPGMGQQPPGGWQAPPAPAPSRWAGAPLAGWGSRAGATLLDWLIMAVAVVPLVVIVVAIAAGSHTGAVVVGIIAGLGYLAALLFYAPLLMAREGEHNGQTWGKQIAGIRVVRDTGQPFELGSAFVREFVVKGLLFATVGGFFLSIPTLLDWLWPLWDDENRALHDMVISTHVMRT